ncbi:RDD family protein [Nocardioides zhouii]|uniref:RDD family protein n=1 Tax=Nocardioides zhouii TaxID=1168729 RepID=UPI0013EDBF1F|nr:RDD family protein [Nocardioides zhouii]
MPQPDPTYAPTDLTPAGWGRRILAILIDWGTSWAAAAALVETGVVEHSGTPGTVILIAEMAFFTALLGGSFGKLLTRVRVVRHDDPSRPVGLLRALVRTALTFLLIPPLLTFEGRGLHDLAAGTRTVTI